MPYNMYAPHDSWVRTGIRGALKEWGIPEGHTLMKGLHAIPGNLWHSISGWAGDFLSLWYWRSCCLLEKEGKMGLGVSGNGSVSSHDCCSLLVLYLPGTSAGEHHVLF